MEVFVWDRAAVGLDGGFAAGAVAGGCVAALEHEGGDYAVDGRGEVGGEGGAIGAEEAEVAAGGGGFGGEEGDADAGGGGSADGEVEVDVGWHFGWWDVVWGGGRMVWKWEVEGERVRDWVDPAWGLVQLGKRRKQPRKLELFMHWNCTRTWEES